MLQQGGVFSLGIEWLTWKYSFRSMEDHYKELCGIVKSRAILSLGITCFTWRERQLAEGITSKSVPVKAEVFNVWLLSQQPFTTDPSSAKFLVQHGFDFNKQFSFGLPYCPPSTRNKASPAP